jgi:hypothetical protein
MQSGVRVWYLGGVDTGGITSSNAEEAYLLGTVTGGDIQVTHHSALEHWGSPKAVETGTYQVGDKGPCWIHPLVLQNLKAGDYWMGQELTLVTPMSYTYDTFPYSFLPTKALFDLKAQREVVKLSYMIAGFSVGNAYFDSDTGLLLYYHTLWGASKLFFILSEINYDFATLKAFTEDDGPHTGFKSLVSEQSLGENLGSGGGGSVVIQSLVETRYGDTVEMRVLTSTAGPSIQTPLSDQNYCFFGDVPILRCMDATEAPNYPPSQWIPCGEFLWWWIPPAELADPSITVLDVPMSRTAIDPYLFSAAESPTRFFFSEIWYGNDGYMTQFSAEDPQISLDIHPDDFIFQNLTTVYGLEYYRNTMGRANPVPVDPLIGGSPVEGLEDWFLSDWFGYYSTAIAPWIYHGLHGFLYHYPSSTNESMFVYDDAMRAWWWTNETVYPFLYVFDPPADNAQTDIEAEWLFYFDGSSAPRSFGVVTGPSAGSVLFF